MCVCVCVSVFVYVFVCECGGVCVRKYISVFFFPVNILE